MKPVPGGIRTSISHSAFMQSTRVSLLSAASSGTEQAWNQLVELYRPLVFGWLLRHDVSHHDAEDLSQDVMAVVVRELPHFEHCGSTGAFRNWLRTITANRAKGFWRRQDSARGVGPQQLPADDRAARG